MLDRQSEQLFSCPEFALSTDSGVSISNSPAVAHVFEKQVARSEPANVRPPRPHFNSGAARIADDLGPVSEESRAAFNPIIRFIDIMAALAALIAFAPIMIAIAIAIKIFDSGPVFFAHKRMGQFGRTFGCLKFRSMVVNADQRLKEHLSNNPAAAAEWALDHKLRNDPRITPLGRFLRKSSLDELPQLFNVLRGEMSLVGPRPIVAAEVERYGRYFADYCSVRPGITGLWQVSGRNDVTYRRRVALDVTYSRTQSLKLYAWIIYRTVPALLFQRGSY